MYLVNVLPTRGQLHVAIGPAEDGNRPASRGYGHTYFLRRHPDAPNVVEMHVPDAAPVLIPAASMSAILGPIFDDWWNPTKEA